MGTVAFNQPLDKWNTSGVINMTKMFANTHSFNQNINGWDVSKVKYMSAMFYKSERFNKPLDGWDVSSVEYMTDMFAYTNFNQPLRDWELASLKDARGMFETSEVLMNHKMFPGKLFSDYLFLEKVQNRMALIGRKCNVFYNDKFDAAKEQQIGDCFDCYMDDDVYSERP